MMSSQAVKIKSMQTVSSNDEDPICCLLIPNHMLYNWYSQKSTIVDLLNEKLADDGVVVVRQCSNTEERLRRRASKVYNKISQEYRWKKKRLMEMSSEYMLYKNEMIKAHELKREIDKMNECIDKLK